MKKKLVLVSLVGEFNSGRKYNRGVAPFLLKAFAETDPEIVRNYEIDIKIFDFDDDEEVILKDVFSSGPDVAGFSCFFWNAEKTMNVARKLKLVSPRVKIILGGPQVTEELFRATEWLDFAAVGEGEVVLRDLLKSLVAGDGPDTVKGLTYRDGGEVYVSDELGFIEDLGDLPVVTECDDFIELNKDSDVKKFPLEISRGCPFSCTYCKWNLHKVRFIPIDRIEKNVHYIISSLPKGREFIFDFIDAYMDINVSHLKDVLRLLIKYKKPNVFYRAYFLFRKIDDELIDLLEEANFTYVYFGLQTMRLDLMPALNRKWFKMEALDNVIALRDRLHVGVDLIYGLPGDTYEDFRNSVETLWERGIDHITVQRLRVMPGTTLYRERDNHDLVFDESPPHMVYSSGTFSFADMKRARQFIINFTVIKTLLTRPDVEFIEKEYGKDIFAISEEIHVAFPEWDGFIRKDDSGYNEVPFDPEVIFTLGKYLESIAPPGRRHGPLRSTLKLRKAEYDLAELRRIVRDESPRNFPASAGDLEERRIRLPGYFRITLSHDALNPGGPYEAGAYSKPKVFFLINNYESNTVEVIDTHLPDVVEILFKLLRKPIKKETVVAFMTRSLEGLSAEVVESFFDLLREKSALVFREETR